MRLTHIRKRIPPVENLLSLRKQTLVIIGVLALVVVLNQFVISRVFIRNRVIEAEEQHVRTTMSGVVNAYNQELANIENMDLGRSVRQEKDYTSVNMDYDVLNAAGLNVILLYDHSGNMVFSKAVDLELGREIEVPQGLVEYITAQKSVVQNPHPESSTTGTAVLPDGHIMIASKPITWGTTGGIIDGTAVMGRFVDESLIDRLATIPQIPLSMQLIGSRQADNNFEQIVNPSSTMADIHLRPISEDSISGYAVIKDFMGRPCIIFEAILPRDIYADGMQSIFYLTLFIGISAATIGGLTILLLEKSILSRVLKFNKKVKSISKSKNFSDRVDLGGKDEIGQLASNVNNMLAELKQSHEELQRYNHLLKDYQQHLEDKVDEQVKEISRLYLGAIESLVYALEAKDTYTAGHSRRVTDIAVMIGENYGVYGADLDDLRWGSLLHDVGKIAVDPVIQDKPGKLTAEEYEHIMIHVDRGAAMVNPFANERIVQIIRNHHSRFDGRGLKQTESGTNIPLGARIIAVADTFDAMTSDRPYRIGMRVREAVDEIIRCSGTQFDPKVVEIFVRIYASIPAIPVDINGVLA